MIKYADFTIRAFDSYEKFIKSEDFLKIMNVVLEEIKMYNIPYFIDVFTKIKSEKNLQNDEKEYLLKLINDRDLSFIFARIMQNVFFIGTLKDFDKLQHLFGYKDGKMSSEGLVSYVKEYCLKKASGGDQSPHKESAPRTENPIPNREKNTETVKSDYKDMGKSVQPVKHISEIVKKIPQSEIKPEIKPEIKQHIQPPVSEKKETTKTEQPTSSEIQSIVSGKKREIVQNPDKMIVIDRDTKQQRDEFIVVEKPVTFGATHLCKVKNTQGLYSYLDVDMAEPVRGWFLSVEKLEDGLNGDKLFKAQLQSGLATYVSLKDKKNIGEYASVDSEINTTSDNEKYIKVTNKDGRHAYISLMTGQPYVGWFQSLNEVESGMGEDTVFLATDENDRSMYISMKFNSTIGGSFRSIIGGLEDGYDGDKIFKAENDKGERGYVSIMTGQPIGGRFKNIFYGIEEGVDDDKYFKVEDARTRFSYISLKTGMPVIGWYSKVSLEKENDQLLVITENMFGMQRKTPLIELISKKE